MTVPCCFHSHHHWLPTVHHRFDRGGKGYLKPSDWGMLGLGKIVERFSVSYMQKFLGLPDITATPEQVGGSSDVVGSLQSQKSDGATQVHGVEGGWCPAMD